MNTGNLTVTGTVQGSTAAISGTTMTGAGFVWYPSGQYALGNSTTNMTFNGTTGTLNGNWVATGNLFNNAVTNMVTASGNGNGTIVSNTTWCLEQSVTITTTGAPIAIFAHAKLTDNGSYGYPSYKIRIDGTLSGIYHTGGTDVLTGQAYVGTGGAAAISPICSFTGMGAGTHTIYFLGAGDSSNSFNFLNCALIVIELKK